MNKVLLFLARSKKIPCSIRFFSLLIKYCPTIIAPIVINKRASSSSIFIDHPRCIIQSSILYEGSYEPEISELFLNLIRPEDSFLDIGANIGYYSVLAIGASARSIIAIEPSKELFTSLMKNLKYNFAQAKSKTSAILPFNLGFGDKNQSLQFITPGPSNLGVGRFIDSSHGDTVASSLLTYPVIPGDQLLTLLPFKPTVVKIDIEGFEYKALTGMIQFLESADKPRIIIIETSFHFWDGNNDSFSPLALLSSYGYKITHIRRHNAQIEKYENFLASL